MGNYFEISSLNLIIFIYFCLVLKYYVTALKKEENLETKSKKLNKTERLVAAINLSDLWKKNQMKRTKRTI